MDERTLQTLSKALTLLIFRMGAVEKLHAIGACLDDETMKKLNMDINNRFYSLLTIWFNGSDEDAVNLEHTLNFMVKVYGRNWDKAQTVDMLMK